MQRALGADEQRPSREGDDDRPEYRCGEWPQSREAPECHQSQTDPGDRSLDAVFVIHGMVLRSALRRSPPQCYPDRELFTVAASIGLGTARGGAVIVLASRGEHLCDVIAELTERVAHGRNEPGERR